MLVGEHHKQRQKRVLDRCEVLILIDGGTVVLRDSGEELHSNDGVNVPAVHKTKR